MPAKRAAMRFVGKKKNTSVWYTNVISYVAKTGKKVHFKGKKSKKYTTFALCKNIVPAEIVHFELTFTPFGVQEYVRSICLIVC